MSSIKILSDQQQAAQNRAAAAENQARSATHSASFTTHGNGYFIDPAPLKFDCVFTVEPAIAHAVSLVKAPNTKHYKYPICNAGVYKWITKSSPGDAGKAHTDPSAQPHYVGCYVYFVVQCDPLVYPRTDGSNLAALQAQLATEQAKDSPNSDIVSALKANIAEAKEALYLNTHPPKVVMNHHLSFSQIALKALPDQVTSALGADPNMSPNSVSYT